MIGPVASAVTLETILAYSRETEREADAMGRDYLAKAGYDPREAVVIWQLLLEESEALPKEERPVFLATHPAIRERIANLEEANANSSIDPTTLESGRGRYDAVVQSYRALWIQDEFRKRKLAQSEVIMKHLLKADPSSGELQFYQGEIYRLRNGKEDRALAIDYYRHALSFRDAPPEAYRSLGLVLWDQDDTVAAGAAFEAYLENKPTADDRLMIESYIEDLKKKNVL